MKKLHANPTTAENLETKFDRGDDVLDYFKVSQARVVVSSAEPSGAKSESRVAHRRVVAAETPPPYRKKR